MLDYLGFTHKVGRMVPRVFPIVHDGYTRGVSVPDRRRARNPDPDDLLDARDARAHAAASSPTRAEPSESLRIARPTRANMPCARPTASAVRVPSLARARAVAPSARSNASSKSRAIARARAGPSGDVKKVVLAYSGGLDTSIILKWLQDTYGCEVVTFTADLGQGEELEPARAKAAQFGVKEIFVDDLREEFVRDYVFPMFRANAVYEGTYLLGTSIARPLIAKRQIEIAKQVGADAVCHGATGKGCLLYTSPSPRD